jgi:hypothetical protein
MDYIPYIVKTYNVDLQPSNSKQIDKEIAKSVLYPGAHIATSNAGDYFHHGIVIDPEAPDISIIHFWGPDKNNSRIETTTLPIFIAGGIDYLGKVNRNLYLVNYEGDTLQKQQETVQVAKEMLTKADDIKYDLATLNCESFACFCRTGKWDTAQIARLEDVLIQNSQSIYEQVKNANEKNRKNIASMLKMIPPNVLPPSTEISYDQLCHCHSDQHPE